jgi:hypothetical protein
MARSAGIAWSDAGLSGEALDELAWSEDPEVSVWSIDRKEVSVAGDDGHGSRLDRERDEVVVVWVTADAPVGLGRVRKEDRLRGKIAKEAARFVGLEVLAQSRSGEDQRDL